MNIHVPQFPSIHNNNYHNRPNSSKFNYKIEGFIVIQTRPLIVAFKINWALSLSTDLSGFLLTLNTHLQTNNVELEGHGIRSQVPYTLRQ